MPGPGIELETLHLVLSTLPLDGLVVEYWALNVSGSIPGPSTRKVFIKKIIEGGWALQINGTEINWK